MAVHQPYAKLQSEELIYYMWRHEMTFGRKGADITINDDKSVSRIHARIAFSPVRQRFEVHVLGKNGVILNGICHLKGSPPIHIPSHSEIIVGRKSPLVMTFLLPVAPAEVDDMSYRMPTVEEPLVNMIGKLIVSSRNGKLSPNQIIEEFARKHRALAIQMGMRDGRLASSIRHSIRLYPEFFETNVADDAQKSPEASFSVSKDHLHLFVDKVIGHQTPNGLPKDTVDAGGDVGMKELVSIPQERSIRNVARDDQNRTANISGGFGMASEMRTTGGEDASREDGTTADRMEIG
eukprot:Plantae.Rhodophyta-Hildenbrandia_rubra.ctg26222.p1 GENE.Plantae.Rhodophyta-Hildenbrandia_rubra.ctg26222~~Plantae.Rhodophyta-Hildenbrandia_rubra.ctg26222.p1  ORF type:complete len:293 (-),score=58.74 Plantae.Rhodophyta-Hildenbrandia_rubra.ctg26222:722-1600(-)